MKQILNFAKVYQLYQWLVGANKYNRMFANEYIKYIDGQSILDIGCGPADILRYLPLDVDYTGIDLSKQYVAKARIAHPRQKFICGDIGHPDFPLVDHLFDTVFLIGVQHHLTDEVVQTMFEFAQRKLKPGGRILCLEPVCTSEQGVIERWFMRNDRGKYIRDESGYINLMRTHFKEIKTEIKHHTMNIPFTIIILEASKP